jgi:hypothetical protein
MKNLLLASTCALACAVIAPPAFAEGIAFTGQGSFGNIAGFPTWSGEGSLNVPLDWYSGLSVEGNLGDRGFDSEHTFDGGGSVIWTDPDFRLAGSVLYNRLSAGGSSIDETQYGGGAEWFFSPWLTASAQGGGISGQFSGGYVGGHLKGYIMPDMAVDGFVNYTSLSGVHETDYGAHAEWLPMEDLPVSVGATYDHINISGSGFGSGNTDAWFATVKLYLNDSPATTLVDRQRTGTLDTISPAFNFIF